jgi:hypothetical protein
MIGQTGASYYHYASSPPYSRSSSGIKVTKKCEVTFTKNFFDAHSSILPIAQPSRRPINSPASLSRSFNFYIARNHASEGQTGVVARSSTNFLIVFVLSISALVSKIPRADFHTSY